MGSILAFLPILVLMWRGTAIRERFGAPRNVNVFDQQRELVEGSGDGEGVREKI